MLTIRYILLLACLPAGLTSAESLKHFQAGLERVSESARALGAGRIVDAGGIRWHCSGWRDLNARYQGLDPAETNRVPLEETLVMAAPDGAISWRVDSKVNADAVENMRYDYDGGGGLLIVDRLNRRAFRDRGDPVVEQRGRQARMVPDVLLMDALNARASLRSIGDQQVNVTLAGETLTLFFEPDTSYPAAVKYLLDMPLQGDSLVRWEYGDWREVDGLGPWPRRYSVAINGRTYKRLECEPPRAGVTDEVMAMPDGIELPEPLPETAASSPEPAEEPALPAPRELADNVWLVPGIRGGFHPLLVAFDDFSVVVDAPSGWYELDQLPAYNWSAGETASSVGKRLLAVAREHLPDKPVRYLVLTHWHSDHAGGLRPFAAAGVEIVTAPETIEVAKRALAAEHTLVPDALTGKPARSSFIAVDGRHVIKDGSRELHVLDVGDNPHADGMLVAWLPEEKILYQSDLFEPLPERFFPSKERLTVMQWFVDWLDASGLDPERIYAIHGTARVTAEQLDIVRTSRGN